MIEPGIVRTQLLIPGEHSQGIQKLRLLLIHVKGVSNQLPNPTNEVTAGGQRFLTLTETESACETLSDDKGTQVQHHEL